MVIVVSGYSRDSAVDADIPRDAVFLSKPFDVPQLRRAILEA